MPPRASSRSRDGVFPKSMSPMRVPETIRAVNSGESLCSAITLDDELDHFTMRSIHRKDTRSLSPIPSPQPKEFRKRAHRRQSDGGTALKGFHNRRRRSDIMSQSGHNRPFSRMELDNSSHRDTPPKVSRRSEPLSTTARDACLQDLGYLEFEDGRKETKLVDRFSTPLPCEDGEEFLPPLPKYKRAVSSESDASMPLTMPIRKASMEKIPLGFCPCSSQALQKPLRQWSSGK